MKDFFVKLELLLIKKFNFTKKLKILDVVKQLMGTFFIECIIIFIYYDFFIFLFDIIFLYYYFLSILTLFCDLCIAHTDFLFSYILYILIETIDNCCWYMVYREDFFHTYFFYDFTIIFYLSTFFPPSTFRLNPSLRS